MLKQQIYQNGILIEDDIDPSVTTYIRSNAPISQTTYQVIAVVEFTSPFGDNPMETLPSAPTVATAPAVNISQLQ